MRSPYKIISSRILVLVIVISSAQNAVAIDFNQNMHGGETQVMQILLSDIRDIGVGNDYLMDHSLDNTSHINCTAQCYFTFLHDSNSTLMVTRSRFRQKIVVDNSVYSSPYPDLLERPPKI